MAANLLHGKVARVLLLDRLVLMPEVLVVAIGDLDVGVVLANRQQLFQDDVVALAGIRFPVIAIGGLGDVDIPVVGGVALADDLVGQSQC